MKFSPPRVWLRYPLSIAWRWLEAFGTWDLEAHVFVVGWWAFIVCWRVPKRD